ncbi:tyrosine-type recombinase/integrase [Kitasatospora sp. NPDC015120]|uniref:tyrosine-type recombinase/integrase n=1 Tax=Kitasatospora sp. NPDC015120 TaxID=3364023 RepID=UPI0036F47395
MFEKRTYKRCTCKGPKVYQRGPKKGQPILNRDGTPKLAELGSACPDLETRGHGSWYFFLYADSDTTGRAPIRVRRGGFRTQDDAIAEAKTTWEDIQAGLDVTVEETFGEYLLRWVEKKKSVALSTADKYEEHIRLHINPFAGQVDRRAVRKHHIEAMFAGIQDRNTTIQAHREYVALLTEDCERKREAWRNGSKTDRPVLRASWHDARELLASERKKMRRITDLPTQHRIKATLSSALADAVRAEEVRKNWAELVELPSASPPKPMLWTPARVARWRETGEIPGKVMVWTPQLTGEFLDFTVNDPLFDLWHFMALRGPRRGEACALSWTEVDLDAMSVTISRQVVSIAYKLFGTTPKAGSERILSLDTESARLLEKRRLLQAKQRIKAGPAWKNEGRVFAQEDGSGYHPDYLTHRFKKLVELAQMPPITLHGLRHGAACIAHVGGSKPKEISEQLGHSTIKITMDTYTNVLPEVQRVQAEAALAVVPRSGRPAAPAPAAATATPEPPPAPVAAVPAQATPAAAPEVRPASGGRLTALRRVREKRAAEKAPATV